MERECGRCWGGDDIAIVLRESAGHEDSAMAWIWESFGNAMLGLQSRLLSGSLLGADDWWVSIGRGGERQV